jgi:hypothetical protein
MTHTFLPQDPKSKTTDDEEVDFPEANDGLVYPDSFDELNKLFEEDEE